MKKTLMLLIAALFSLFTSCGSDQYPDLEDGLYAEFVTDHGTMVAELYYEQTPATVGNFVALVEGTHPMVTKEELKGKPFYDGLTFHRIIKGFMIQGGDPDGNGRGGPGYKFHDEFVDELKHTEMGILSMANSGPNTNGSQFFICEKATPYLDGRHTVWGKVIKGLEVITAIADVKKDGNPQQGKPMEPVYMKTVRIIRKGSAAKAFDGAKTFQDELAGLEEKRAKAAAEKAKQFKSFKDAFDAKKAKAESFPSGLQMFWDKKGDGVKPAEGARVKVDYAGFFESGELFDTSISSIAEAQDKIDPRRQYQPLQTTVSASAQMIAGFNEAIMQLKMGDKATIFIPTHLAWGAQGSRGVIPPNANVIFEVEIVEIIK